MISPNGKPVSMRAAGLLRDSWEKKKNELFGHVI